MSTYGQYLNFNIPTGAGLYTILYGTLDHNWTLIGVYRLAKCLCLKVLLRGYRPANLS